MTDYSILMSVYHKENPVYLCESINSMLSQTVKSNDFVIVCDGPLTPELDAALDKFSRENPELFQILRLPQNVGIGVAAGEGLKMCKNDLVAKMDSDDLAFQGRCAKQLALFEEKSGLSIVGAHILEFEDDINNTVSMRRVPLSNEDIARYAKRRMPFNNQTVMFRKSAVISAGGYSSLRRCEDYELYARMLHMGFVAENIDEALVYYRLTKDAYDRRGSWEHVKGFISVRWQIHKSGFSSFWDFILPCCGQLLLAILPSRLKAALYVHVLRR